MVGLESLLSRQNFVQNFGFVRYRIFFRIWFGFSTEFGSDFLCFRTLAEATEWDEFEK